MQTEASLNYLHDVNLKARFSEDEPNRFVSKLSSCQDRWVLGSCPVERVHLISHQLDPHHVRLGFQCIRVQSWIVSLELLHECKASVGRYFLFAVFVLLPFSVCRLLLFLVHHTYPENPHVHKP